MAGSSLLVNNTRPSFEVDGQVESRLSEDLIRLEVRLDELGIARMEAVFLNWGRKEIGAEPGYVYFDGETVDLGRGISVRVGASDNEHLVFTGVVTSIEGIYSNMRPPEICLRAETSTQWLRMRRHTRFFENQSDGDIARQIADDHGQPSDIGQNGTTHTELWQVNQSDLDFLRDRARAADARLAVEDGALVFRPRREENAEPIPLSRENELLRFCVGADLAHQRSEVRVHGYDVAQKAAIHETAGSDVVIAEAENEGRTGPEVLAAARRNIVEDLHLEAPATADEARRIAESLMKRRARRFVWGWGMTSGTPELRVGSRVDLVDLGDLFAGIYYLAEVRHTYDQRDGLRTHFLAEKVTLGGGS